MNIIRISKIENVLVLLLLLQYYDLDSSSTNKAPTPTPGPATLRQALQTVPMTMYTLVTLTLTQVSTLPTGPDSVLAFLAQS